MARRVLLAVYFLATISFTNGDDANLKCYTCTGTSTAGAANKCVDADLSDADSKDCTDVVGQVKCYYSKAKTGSVVHVIRGCAAWGGDDDCTSTEVGEIETHLCYCSTDNCNGQTALVPAVVTCLVSLLLAVYASE